MFGAVLSRSRCTVSDSNRGFTLIELLAVVVITGILSVVAVEGFRRHMQAARGAEPVAVIVAIRSAQEAYMAENHVYLNVSTDSGGKTWYPRITPNKDHASFVASNQPDYPRWRQLAPSIKQSVMFSYLVNAGVPGTVIPPLQELTAGPSYTVAQPLDWYMIQAKGDVDGNGVFSHYASSSMSGELYIENESE